MKKTVLSILLLVLLALTPAVSVSQIKVKTCTTSTSGGPYSDTFPGTSLSGNWTVDNGGFATTSNTVYPTLYNAGVVNVAHYSGGTFTNDQTTQATLANTPNTGLVYAVGVRIGKSGAVCQGYFIDGGSTSTYSVKKFNGTNCGFSTVASSGFPTAASGDVIKIQVTGNSITVWVNGVSHGPYTDTAFPTGGAPGIVLGRSSGGTYNALSTWSGQ